MCESNKERTVAIRYRNHDIRNELTYNAVKMEFPFKKNDSKDNSFWLQSMHAFRSELGLSPIYEHHDFAGKMRERLFRHKFRSTLAPIEEAKVILQNNGLYVTNLNKNRILCEKVSQNDIDFVIILLNSGVNPNCYDDHKRTPLHVAVSKGFCEMVLLLLSFNANPNIKDGIGNSCLHLAACTNNVEMALILIKNGASVHSVDIRGRSPIQLAQSKLRILQRSTDAPVKSKVTQIIDMLLVYLEKTSEKLEKNNETELLSCFHNRLRITDTPEQISNELDNLSKILNQMESLAIK